MIRFYQYHPGITRFNLKCHRCNKHVKGGVTLITGVDNLLDSLGYMVCDPCFTKAEKLLLDVRGLQRAFTVTAPKGKYPEYVYQVLA